MCVCIYVCMYVSHLFIFHLLVDTYIASIILVIINKAAMFMLEWIYLFGYMCVFGFSDFAFRFLFCLDKHPRVDLIHWMAVLFLSFWGTSVLFSILVVLIYIPTNSVYGFHFLHILASICYFLSFWWKPFWQIWRKAKSVKGTKRFKPVSIK